MGEPADWIMDVDADGFKQAVLDAPAEVAVVVDFWAPWCAPCRTLSPVLERIVGESGGRLRLAKVNVDENPPLAAQFGVQGIPQVLVFRGGEVVADFTGALPERQVRQILS